jgi:hypothetical protein
MYTPRMNRQKAWLWVADSSPHLQAEQLEKFHYQKQQTQVVADRESQVSVMNCNELSPLVHAVTGSSTSDRRSAPVTRNPGRANNCGLRAFLA